MGADHSALSAFTDDEQIAFARWLDGGGIDAHQVAYVDITWKRAWAVDLVLYVTRKDDGRSILGGDGLPLTTRVSLPLWSEPPAFLKEKLFA